MATTEKKFGHILTGSQSQTKTATIQDKFRRFRATIGLKSRSDRRAEKIQGKAGRFRVLIIGRANAGKTTILQKVCNTSEQPEIFDSRGKKSDTSAIAPTALRGLHNIENELVFQSNQGFIFHDSRGFEAGGIAELHLVKEFIAKRSKMEKISDQLHVIWYCIPMDDERPFTAAERNFFSECGTGSVPVVAIFTKFDALEDKAFGDLEDEGVSERDAIAQAPARAVADFEKTYLPELYSRKYPPSGHVYLRDMNKQETDCRELTETIAAVLTNDNLQRLFVTTQKNNLEICMKYAVKRALIPVIKKMDQLTGAIPTTYEKDIVGWYPNFRYYWDVYEEYNVYNVLRADVWLDNAKHIDMKIMESSTMQSKMLQFIGPPPVVQQMARLGVALAIMAEHSFYLWDLAPANNDRFLISAIDIYESSAKHVAVAQAVDEAFEDDGGRLFEKAKRSRHPGQSVFAERLIQITLDNRLPPPQST